MADREVVTTEQWILVGESAQSSLLVRSGRAPFAIRVSHSDSNQLIQLIREANQGIQHGSKA